MEIASDKKQYCMYFNSGVPCPLQSNCTKQYIHSEERKKITEALFRLGLYYRKPTNKVLCYSSRSDRDYFYQNLRKQKICENYYLLGKCDYDEKDCFIGQHISPETQKNKLNPIAPNQNWKPPMCRFGEHCLKKNKGCRYSHEEENLKDEIRYGKELKTEESQSLKTVEKKGVKKIDTVNEEETKLQKKTIPQKVEKHPNKAESSNSSAREGESTGDDEVERSEVNEESKLSKACPQKTNHKASIVSEISEEPLCQACPVKTKNKANIMFLPCGHQARCTKCAQKYLLNKGKECCLCDKPVKFIKFIKID